MTGPADPGPAPESYPAAMAELESILQGLEDDDLDVDALAARIARAADLLRWCRWRIAETKIQVEQVVNDLEPDEQPPA